jgi:hypothetical protein
VNGTASARREPEIRSRIRRSSAHVLQEQGMSKPVVHASADFTLNKFQVNIFYITGAALLQEIIFIALFCFFLVIVA